MSDTSFETLLLTWLGRDSMQNTDDPAQFATLLDIIANVTLSDVAKKAACELLLHIHKDDAYAETLLFRRVDGQAEEDEDDYLVPMQTRFAKALYHCGEILDWVDELFPKAENLGPNVTHPAREYLGACLVAIINGDQEFSSRFFSWDTIVTFAEQYTPEDCSSTDLEAYTTLYQAARLKLDERLGQAA